MVAQVPSPHDPHVRQLRRMFLAVVTGSFLFLIPWIGYLSVSLPDHHEVDQWRFAWVGFDAALIVAIGVTALCAWRRLQIFIPWAIVTATLLCCDAWFDIVLDWNSGDLAGAVLTAAVAELPLAFLLVHVARKVIRLTLIMAWHHAGRAGTVPPLSRLTLVRLTAQDPPDPPDPSGGPDTPVRRRDADAPGPGERAGGSHRHPGPGAEDPARPRSRPDREPGPGHDRDGERR